MSEKPIIGIYDGHGHSRHSDGFHNPEKVVQKAVGRVNILGLSDHDTVQGLFAFLTAVDKVNQGKQILLPIPSVELTTRQGHLLVAIPDIDKADNFLSRYKIPKKNQTPLKLSTNASLTSTLYA